MLRFVKLADRPRKLYRMTGLTREQFGLLSNRLKPLWEQAERDRLSRPGRKRDCRPSRAPTRNTISPSRSRF